MNRVYFKNTLVLLGPGYRGSFGVFLPGGAYKSKSALFSGAAAFHLPTVSPLKASYIFGLQMVRILFLSLHRENLTRQLDGGWKQGSTQRWRVMWGETGTGLLNGKDLPPTQKSHWKWAMCSPYSSYL